jgi:hypothetical protein
VNDNTAGTNTIAGYDRQPNGALPPIPGSPFATGGAGAGKAKASQGSTVSLPAGSQPGDILFNSRGSKLVGTRVASSLIDSFAVAPRPDCSSCTVQQSIEMLERQPHGMGRAGLEPATLGLKVLHLSGETGS